MTACLNCQKEVVPKEGKRAKKFCSDACRAAYYQKHKPKGPSRYVLRSTHEKVIAALSAELKELKDKVRWASEPLVPRVVQDEPFVSPLLEEALSRPPKPLPQASAYDFTGKKWLNVEEYTKYPIKARPESKSERLEWDRLRREEHEQIKQAWANRNKH